MNTEKTVRPEVSERMRNQKIVDTKPESEIAKACFGLGLRYRKDVEIPEAKTRGDLVFARHKMVVFIDGCFWHGCPKCYKPPKSNRKFWVNKISSNIKRDRKVSRTLRAQGWAVLRVWECSLKI